MSRTISFFCALTIGVISPFALHPGPAAAVPVAGDLDGDLSGPADCAPLDPSVHPGAADRPDLEFTDTNCDGIDGDITDAVFVSSTAPNDDGSGTRANPKKLITSGIALAAPTGKDVYVTGGTFPGILALADNVGVYGGYTPDFSDRAEAETTTVNGVNGPGAFAVGDTGVVLQLVTLHGQREPDGNSYGLRAVPDGGAEASQMVLENVDVTADPTGAAMRRIRRISRGQPGLGFCGGVGGAGGCGSASGCLRLPGFRRRSGQPGQQRCQRDRRQERRYHLASAASPEWPVRWSRRRRQGGRGGTGATNVFTNLCGGRGGLGGPGGRQWLWGHGWPRGRRLVRCVRVQLLGRRGRIHADGRERRGRRKRRNFGGNGGFGALGTVGLAGECVTIFVQVCAGTGSIGQQGFQGGRGGGGGGGVGGPSAAVYQGGPTSGYTDLRRASTFGIPGLGGLQGDYGIPRPRAVRLTRSCARPPRR